MTDKFQDHTSALDSPASHAFAVLPSDGELLPETTRAIYIGVSGDIAVAMKSGAEMLFTNVQSGALLAVRAAQV
ncbi:MAG: hypothetical protein L0H37_10750, partial [Nitrosospira sp.]|nr:hypothetical protein [Nitrosospira sp.]